VLQRPTCYGSRVPLHRPSIVSGGSACADTVCGWGGTKGYLCSGWDGQGSGGLLGGKCESACACVCVLWWPKISRSDWDGCRLLVAAVIYKYSSCGWVGQEILTQSWQMDADRLLVCWLG